MKLYKVQSRIIGSARATKCVRILLDKGHISVYNMVQFDHLLYYADQGKEDEFYNFAMEEKYIPVNLLELSDEEFFQESLVWDYPVDIHLLRNVQRFYESNYPEVNNNRTKEWFQTFGDS